LHEALFDFNLGYGATTIMAVLFLSLGALVMYGSGARFESGPAAFAGQLISMYTAALGKWSRPFILTAAFTCMLSTTLTVIDGYPRVIAAGIRELRPISERTEKTVYWVLNALLCIGALLIIRIFSARGMLPLVVFITTVAFLSAPLLAIINHLTLRKAKLPQDAYPPTWLWWLSRYGILFLLGFSGLYIWSLVVNSSS
jgi:Mn2+/Fe2+ NRAMP family transporter